MSDRFLQHGVARSAAFLAALALVLPPLAGTTCACVVKQGEQCHCGHCDRAGKSSQPAVRTCCARHRSVATKGLSDQNAGAQVCHCHHGQQRETPVAPVNQTQTTVDQLALAQASISVPVAPTNVPVLSANSANEELCIAADTSLERCVLLSRLTL